jgi:hypothetical protein
MTQSPQLLRQILQRITKNKAQGQKSLVVFDLDSTLFDVSPRLQQILHDFANNSENAKKFPDSVEILKTIEMQRSDWGIRNALMRSGLANHSSEFHQAVKHYWIDSFFTNHYLHYDRPYEGAAEFVQKVAAEGADIVYLSGRDHSGMSKGTIEVLKKWHFPIDDMQIRLALKPQKGMDDAEFKRDWFLAIPREAYSQVWFFENEPLNVQSIREHFDHIDIVFFESTHAGKAPPPTDLPKIFHFLMSDED